MPEDCSEIVEALFEAADYYAAAAEKGECTDPEAEDLITLSFSDITHMEMKAAQLALEGVIDSQGIGEAYEYWLAQKLSDWFDEDEDEDD